MDPSDSAATRKPVKEIPGRWVVIGMFLLAFAGIGFLWVYTVLHNAPFLSLQRALAEEFPEFAPKVEGGRRKIHRNTPPILRIVMKVDFDPTADNDHAESLANRVTAIAQRHHDLSRYEFLEIHLFWPEPEKEIQQWSTTKKVAELLND